MSEDPFPKWFYWPVKLLIAPVTLVQWVWRKLTGGGK